MVEINEKDDDYALVDLYDLIKSHGKNLNGSVTPKIGGPLALVAKEDEISIDGISLSEVDSGGDLCLMVNGKKMYHRGSYNNRPSGQYDNHSGNHGASNWKNGRTDSDWKNGRTESSDK